MITAWNILAIYGALHLAGWALDRIRRFRAPRRLRLAGAATESSAAARERLGLMRRFDS